MIEIIPYEDRFEEGIQLLCRIPVSGNIAISLEREPNYYAGVQIQCEEPEVFVVYDSAANLIWAVFNIGKRRVWHQNNVVSVRYLSDLRIHPAKQKGSLLLRISGHFCKLCSQENLPAQTIVFEDNDRMLHVVEKLKQMKGSSNLPFYHFAGKLITHLFGFKPHYFDKGSYQVRRARTSDIASMQLFFNLESSKINYAPYYDFASLHAPYYSGIQIEGYFLAFQNEQIVGICGTWNQISIKQTRIVSYSKLFRKMKPLYNMLARLTGWSKLPQEGSVLHTLNLHCIFVSDRNPGIFQSILWQIATDFKHENYDYMMCSLSEGDPLIRVFDSVKSRRIKGNYYLVNDGRHIPDDLKGNLFYIDSARI
ncbi:MAG: hypothetical protein IPI60_05725 [Saprospiraceae bacterium]|nr:hypothetical protein [Saprospiraceae bacterium]